MAVDFDQAGNDGGTLQIVGIFRDIAGKNCAEAAVVGGENGLISAFFTGADEVSLKRLGRMEVTY